MPARGRFFLLRLTPSYVMSSAENSDLSDQDDSSVNSETDEIQDSIELIWRALNQVRVPDLFDFYTKDPLPVHTDSPWFVFPSANLRVTGYVNGYPVDTRVVDVATTTRILMEYDGFVSKRLSLANAQHVKSAQTKTRDLFGHLNGSCGVLNGKNEFANTFDTLDQTKSAGVPFSLTGLDMCELRSEIVQAAKKTNCLAKFKSPYRLGPDPCQVSSEGLWHYPVTMTMIEMRFSKSIRNSLRYPTCPIVFDQSRNGSVLEELTSQNSSRGSGGLKIHLKSLYSSINANLVNFAFKTVENWISFEGSERKIKKTKNVWKNIQYFFTSTPLVLPNGQLVRKYGGIPHGSQFADIVASVTALCVAQFCLSVQNEMTFPNSVFFVAEKSVLLMNVSASFSVPKMIQDAKLLGIVLDEPKMFGTVKEGCSML